MVVKNKLSAKQIKELASWSRASAETHWALAAFPGKPIAGRSSVGREETVKKIFSRTGGLPDTVRAVKLSRSRRLQQLVRARKLRKELNDLLAKTNRGPKKKL